MTFLSSFIVLNLATEESDNPDLRDRGYIYWRLLSSDPEAARAVVLSEKPEIGDDTITIEPALLDELISQISTLASIYHKPPDAFIMKNIHLSSSMVDEDTEELDVEEIDEEPTVGPSTTSSTTASAAVKRPVSIPASGGVDLLDLSDSPPVSNTVSQPTNSGSINLLDDFGPNASAVARPSIVKAPIVTAEQGHGVFINGAIVKLNGKISFELDVGNTLATPVSQLAIQFNKNTFGLATTQPIIQLPSPVSNGRFVSLYHFDFDLWL